MHKNAQEAGANAGAGALPNRIVFPQTIKIELPMDPAILGTCPNELNRHLYTCCHCGSTHNSQGTDTQASIDG
jgi:hypothetical protein